MISARGRAIRSPTKIPVCTQDPGPWTCQTRDPRSLPLSPAETSPLLSTPGALTSALGMCGRPSQPLVIRFTSPDPVPRSSSSFAKCASIRLAAALPLQPVSTAQGVASDVGIWDFNQDVITLSHHPGTLSLMPDPSSNSDEAASETADCIKSKTAKPS